MKIHLHHVLPVQSKHKIENQIMMYKNTQPMHSKHICVCSITGLLRSNLSASSLQEGLSAVLSPALMNQPVTGGAVVPTVFRKHSGMVELFEIFGSFQLLSGVICVLTGHTYALLSCINVHYTNSCITLIVSEDRGISHFFFFLQVIQEQRMTRTVKKNSPI